MGTHVLREDSFLRGDRSSAALPHLLCINASAPMPPSSPAPFYVPGLAALSALVQSVQILNVNTVQPRLYRIRQAQFIRARDGALRETTEPLDLVSDLSPVSQNIRFKSGLTHHRDEIRRSDPAVRDWESEILHDVEKWVENIEASSPHTYPIATPAQAQALAETMIGKLIDRPTGEHVRPGMMDYDSWDDLAHRLDEKTGGLNSDATPTILSLK